MLHDLFTVRTIIFLQKNTLTPSQSYKSVFVYTVEIILSQWILFEINESKSNTVKKMWL